MFPVKNVLKEGEASSPLLFYYALDFIIRRVQLDQDGLKLNGTNQLMVYSDKVNILGLEAYIV
jgi:hypothetical protein